MYHWRRPSCLQGGQGQSPQTQPGAAIPMTKRILGHPERVLFSSTSSLIPPQSSPIRLLSMGQLLRPLAPLRSSRGVGPAFARDPLGRGHAPPPALPPPGGRECGQRMLSAGQLRRPMAPLRSSRRNVPPPRTPTGVTAGDSGFGSGLLPLVPLRGSRRVTRASARICSPSYPYGGHGG